MNCSVSSAAEVHGRNKGKRGSTTERERKREREKRRGSDGALLFKSMQNKEAFVWSAERVDWSQGLGSVQQCALTAFLH